MQAGSLLPDLVLIGLLAATLFHAIRLERALGVLRRDRAVLEQLISGFNAATHEAQIGVERLRGAADGAGRELAAQIERANGLRQDLEFLAQRGEAVADRMEVGLRAARPSATQPAATQPAENARSGEQPRSTAERDLLRVLRAARA
jgi:hypothetical protein